MPYALLFPGQASQQVGMGGDFRASSSAARAIFKAADRITNLPLTDVIAHGPLERLTDTRYAQPAVVSTSLATLAVLQDRLDREQLSLPTRCAGHSVGELAALAAAGALSMELALRLVTRRSRLMAEACDRVDGGMAAVFGVDEPKLTELCHQASEVTDQIVDLANINAPGQLVVSGHRQAIEWLQREGPRHGARRVIPLNVGGPFHSAYMRPASEAFAADVSTVPLKAPEVPVVLNQTAHATRDPQKIRMELGQQIAAPVRWSESLIEMVAAGCCLFIEVGPGQVLAGLVRRTVPDAQALSVNDWRGLEDAVAAIGETGNRRDGESASRRVGDANAAHEESLA